MLLRRFTSRLRDQKWAEILVELIIVIAGVFIGIQAANWNDGRQEQERGRFIAERLLADLRKDLDSRKMLVRYYQAVFDSAERTAARLNNEATDHPAAYVLDAYRATEYAHRPQTRAAFDEIVSSGSLGLIPEDARQAGFIEYFRVDNSSAMREAVRASPYRKRVRRLLPYDIQAAIRANCSDVYNDKYEIVGFPETCKLNISERRLELAASALQSDPELLRDLRLHFSVLNAVMPNFRGEVVNLEAAIEALERAR